MKIPKRVDKLLRQRTYYACMLDKVCYELDQWLDKNEVECESCDTHTGVEIYCNPTQSEQRVRECISNANRSGK